MRVFIDIISGDEFFSDSYPHKFTFNGACAEVQARYVKKGSDQIAIASDDIIEEDENAPTVIDIVDSFQLNEANMDKGGVMAWAKGYLAAVKAKMEASGKGDKVEAFMNNAKDIIKFILSKMAEMQCFYG